HHERKDSEGTFKEPAQRGAISAASGLHSTSSTITGGKHPMHFKKLLLLTAGLMVAAGAHAQASWPTQPIKLVVGYSPGGPVDTSARTFAKYLSDELKQPVVVENRTGASGMIAAESIVRATA